MHPPNDDLVELRKARALWPEAEETPETEETPPGAVHDRSPRGRTSG